MAAGAAGGILRIGPAAGGEPHLFFGVTGSPQRVAVSPDGRWVAASGERSRTRLWPVPDVTRKPLHRRSHEEVLATLRSWTNLRAVKDPQSPTVGTSSRAPSPAGGSCRSGESPAPDAGRERCDQRDPLFLTVCQNRHILKE